MLSHFVIKYIQDDTYLMLDIFDDINLTFEVNSCWGITMFSRLTITLYFRPMCSCTDMRIVLVFVGFAAAYILYTSVFYGKPWQNPNL